MSFIQPDLFVALPEITLVASICAVLVADLFVPDHRRVITYWVAMVALLAVSLSVVVSAPTTRVLTFSGSYVSDPLAVVLKLAAVIALALVFLYSRDYLSRNHLRRGEFYTLGLFGLLGIFVMVASNSLLNTYLGLEILSLSLYSLVAFDRDNGVCAEAAMKYFVLGAIASGTLLYGVSLIYGITGTIQLDDLAVAVRDAGTDDVALWFGVAFLVVGIAFKFGGVPFHMWVPDVYQGARTPVTLYIGSLPKAASFALAARVLVEGLPVLQEQWQIMLMVVGVLSIALGNIVAIAQTNIKRMLAYSTISHVGFILLGFFAGTPEGYEAALFYTLTYMLMSAGAFGMIVLLSRQGFEAEEISDFKGLNSRSPWFAAIMACFMFGMAGIPPWVGFWAKLNVIASVISAGRDAGSGELLYTMITLIMVIFSVIGAYYYLRVLKFCYFDQPDEDAAPLEAAGDVRLALSVNGLAVLGLGIVPGGLMALCAAVIA